jgi:hypothetical protein
MAGPSKEGRTSKRSGCLIAVAVIFGISVIGSVASNFGGTTESALDKAERERADEDLATLSVAKRVIQQSMKDPASAEFSNGFGRVKHGQRVACGDVNGKNGFGALAGRQHWLVIADRNVAMVRAPNNQRTFAQLWNKYCTGLDDRDAPMPTEIFGINLGMRPPNKLKPFDASRNVWVFRDARPADYLGMPIADSWFEMEDGRLYGVSMKAAGTEAYEHWRDEIRRTHGAISAVGSGQPPVLTWEWTSRDPKVQLSFNAGTNEVLLSIRMGTE